MNELLSNEKRVILIRNQELFSKLTESEVNELAALFTEVNMKTGDVIVTEGDPVDSIFLIVNGTAEVLHATVEDGKIVYHKIAELKEKQAVGLNETGFYSLSGIRTATVTAKTDMLLLKLSVAAFHGFSLTHAHVSEMMRKNSSKIFS